MTTIALIVVLALLAALAVGQILAASGLPLGRFAWGGKHRVLPRGLRVASAVSVLVYAGLAALLLSRAGILPAGDSAAVIVLTWVAFAFFAASVALNAISRSPAERWTMTPTSLLLAAATLVIALGGG
ncbi:hypothetical protein [Actinomyces sp. ZJ308]|uniref:hypothetical protein n=1 Tax=Actinomyces sp. ZJ308 TaxID=2708342 RepID=UPI00141EBFD7|nr:hypothetical protein [Actinomyces sp. ZJ308]